VGVLVGGVVPVVDGGVLPVVSVVLGGVVVVPGPLLQAAANSARAHVRASAPRNFVFLTFSPFSKSRERTGGERGTKSTPAANHHPDGRRYDPPVLFLATAVLQPFAC
jgi:hypothetical protein